MARPGEGLSEAVSENIEQQKMELETLQSIYYDRIKVMQEDQEYMVREVRGRAYLEYANRRLTVFNPLFPPTL